MTITNTTGAQKSLCIHVQNDKKKCFLENLENIKLDKQQVTCILQKVQFISLVLRVYRCPMFGHASLFDRHLPVCLLE